MPAVVHVIVLFIVVSIYVSECPLVHVPALCPSCAIGDNESINEKVRMEGWREMTYQNTIRILSVPSV